MQALQTIADAIFFGLKIIIPVFFMIRVFNLRSQWLAMPGLARALNFTLLLAANVYLVEILCEIISDHYSEAQRWHSTAFDRATGPYWFSFWLPVIINALMPQLIWVKKVSVGVKLLYVWFLTASLLSVFVSFVTIEVSLHRDYIPSSQSSVGVIYDFLVSPTYFALSLTSTLAIMVALYWLITKQGKKPSLL